METMLNIASYVIVFEIGFFFCWWLSTEAVSKSWTRLFKRKKQIAIDCEYIWSHHEATAWAIKESWDQLKVLSKDSTDSGTERSAANARLDELQILITHHNKRMREAIDSYYDHLGIKRD